MLGGAADGAIGPCRKVRPAATRSTIPRSGLLGGGRPAGAVYPIFGPKALFGIGESPPLATASAVSADRRVIGYGPRFQTW